jgi:tRNA nucleotidyltransferase (CCA-adding enzyme)
VEIYWVGEAVRDELLRLAVEKRDWVIVGASAEEVRAEGYLPDPEDPFAFGHPQRGERYTLARKEQSIEGNQVRVSVGAQVTLREELARRDLTINAMARDSQGRLFDPHDGEEDLRNGTLRHVSPHFARHPEYILLVAQHAALFVNWGFHVAHGTHVLMKRMVQEGAMRALRPSDVWTAFSQTSEGPTPSEFFRVLHRCGALEVLSPPLHACYREQVSHQRGAAPAAALTALDASAKAGKGIETRLQPCIRRLAAMLIACLRRWGYPVCPELASPTKVSSLG